uniref:Uncharacterized protein n=1 Tax=Romanomermis culicivorax TaxID=13658 RepID=A0A915JES9_ROMCU
MQGSPKYVPTGRVYSNVPNGFSIIILQCVDCLINSLGVENKNVASRQNVNSSNEMPSFLSIRKYFSSPQVKETEEGPTWGLEQNGSLIRTASGSDNFSTRVIKVERIGAPVEIFYTFQQKNENLKKLPVTLKKIRFCETSLVGKSHNVTFSAT